MAATDLTNGDIADRFDLLADLLELEGAVVYRILAYRRAAKALRETPESVVRLSQQGKLTSLPGVGSTISDKVGELVATGDIAALKKLVDRNPPGIVPVMRISGIGPKTARRIFDDLGLRTVEDVRSAAREERIRRLPGLGERTEELILEGLSEQAAPASPRISVARLRRLADGILEELERSPAVVHCEVAGSIRRYAETAKDIDLVAAVTNRMTAAEAFTAGEWVARVESSGDSLVAARAHDGTRVELRMVPERCFGNLLQHSTGSKAHNVALREAAVRAGLSVSEHGIEEVATGTVDTAADEAEVYARLGLPWIPPELRENKGELEAARAGRLPELVELGQIRGDLHSHTDWSDGKATLERMVDTAVERGYSYLAITDHSPAVGFGMGLDAGRLRAQIDRVRELAAQLEPAFTLLVGCEVDILKDGSLDYSDELLAELDVVVASVHAGHRLNEKDQTRRVCAAMENPHVHNLGHPTGRMIGVRDPRPLDIEQVIATAIETGTVLEVSAQPHRLDLRDSHVRLAVRSGARLVIDTDAHSVDALDYMSYGVMNARRGWAEPENVVNTREWGEARKLLKA
ncbi:MAG: DNA polymerase/3'-5' exonuclease PolX [Gaiellales bacterium]